MKQFIFILLVILFLSCNYDNDNIGITDNSIKVIPIDTIDYTDNYIQDYIDWPKSIYIEKSYIDSVTIQEDSFKYVIKLHWKWSE